MQDRKTFYLEKLRKNAEKAIEKAEKKTAESDKSKVINSEAKTCTDALIKEVKEKAKAEKWSGDQLLNEILLVHYSSDLVMLESRNRVWEYEYMSFARRIGELWEPFCKLPFEYSLKELKKIDPPDFNQVQAREKKEALSYIDRLEISATEKEVLKDKYSFPWGLVDSGGIKLELDLHFEQNNVHYNIDYKSGFSSNEKGNTNRLLLVGSIYHSLGENEKTMLFVRQPEDENNHYLQTLKNSPYWEVYCAEQCYAAIERFTGFDLRNWLDVNVDWMGDSTKEFHNHIFNNNLEKYLTW